MNRSALDPMRAWPFPDDDVLDARAEVADPERRLTMCRRAGYEDGFFGLSANPPAWGEVAAWSNAYAEGYALGAEARRKIRPQETKQSAIPL